MKYQAFLTIFLGILLSVTASASFNGRWIGDGRLIGHDGKIYPCSHADVTFETARKEFDWGGVYILCAEQPFEFPGYLCDRKGEKLSQRGEVMGSITDTELILKPKYYKTKTLIKKISDERMDMYHSMYVGPDMYVLFEIKLRPKNEE